MRKRIAAVLTGVLLLTACARAQTAADTTAETGGTAAAPEMSAAQTAEPTQTDTRPLTATEPDETEAPTSIRTLPGMIMSDVHVRLWDGDVAPGLRAADAETVKQILASQTWRDSFDNLSDVWIEAEFVPYAYDTTSGILTAADDRAAKLTDADRVQLNAILADYLPGLD